MFKALWDRSQFCLRVSRIPYKAPVQRSDLYPKIEIKETPKTKGTKSKAIGYKNIDQNKQSVPLNTSARMGLFRDSKMPFVIFFWVGSAGDFVLYRQFVEMFSMRLERISFDF